MVQIFPISASITCPGAMYMPSTDQLFQYNDE